MDVERALLTKALMSGQIGALVARGIESRHFSATSSGEACRSVYEWASAHARKYGATPSPALVKQNFPDWHGEPSSDPLEPLVDEFFDEVRRRLFQSKVLELAQVGGDPSKRRQLDEIMLDAARDLAVAVPSASVARLSQMPERVAQYEEDAVQGLEPGIQMGIPLFDDLTHGIRPGRLLTLSGFSGRGKSSCAQWVLANAVEQDKTGLLLSLEMSAQEVMERLDTMVMNFSHRSLTKRELPQEHLDYWRQVADRYARAKSDIVVVDRLGQATIDRVYAEIERYRPDLTVVDYVQLMRGTRESMARWEGLVEITNELKSIALQSGSGIIMVSQDNRSAADTGSTETSGAGSISVFQAADTYIGMQQDEEMRAQRRVRLRLLKNRGGPPAETDLFWEPDSMTFGPWAEGDQAAQFVKST